MEHFIDTVRRYPCLWNTTAIEYRDQELKDAAWAEVMKETDLASVKEAKLKWKKLRDSYRDALKRASEVAARGTEGSANKRNYYPWKYASRMQFLQPYMANRKKAGDSPPPTAPPPRDSLSESSDSEPAPRRRRHDSPAPSPPADRDPLTTFFDGMCQATRRLPPHTQIAIKKTIFSCVIAAEEAVLAERQQHSYAALWPRRARNAPSSSGSDAPPS